MQIISKNQYTLEVELSGKRIKNSDYTESCREVFIFADFVVKADDSDQNQTEFEKYQEIQEEDKNYFPALISFVVADDDRSFLVQEKIEIDAYKDPTEKQREIFKNVVEKYNLSDMFLKGDAFCGSKRLYSHNVTCVGEDSIKIWDLGI